MPWGRFVRFIYSLPSLIFFTSHLTSSVYKFLSQDKKKNPSETTLLLLLLLKSMDSSSKFERETRFPATNQLSSPRSQSFSSLSSCSSSFESSFSGDSPTSPASPPQFSGIPFSWEKTPGIPKKHASRKKENSPLSSLLPLPPSTTTTSSKRLSHQDQETTLTRKIKNNNISESFRRDPFFAAFVECSKEDEDQETLPNIWKNSKVPRNLSDRLGIINMYASCKRTCTVSESIVLVPRSSRSSYHLLNRRSG